MPTRTEWVQLEPVGFGNESFGNPDSQEEGIKIHERKFGTPKTKWTNYEE